jgi:hypothetical protein
VPLPACAVLLAPLPGSSTRPRLWPGEWVRVRPFAEISATLDGDGRLDGLPFMPEMVRHCGQRYRVFRRVEKIHDYFGPTGSHLRRMRDAVLLGRREPWRLPGRLSGDLEGSLARAGRGDLAQCDVRYMCQMTELPHATARLGWSDPRHWLRDLWSGNIRFTLFLMAVALKLFNTVQRMLGGATAPYRDTVDHKTGPVEALNLRPGEMVRIKTKSEIERTLTKWNNRGLWCDVEMHHRSRRPELSRRPGRRDSSHSVSRNLGKPSDLMTREKRGSGPRPSGYPHSRTENSQ